MRIATGTILVLALTVTLLIIMRPMSLSAQEAAVVVEIRDFSFDPHAVMICVGTAREFGRDLSQRRVLLRVPGRRTVHL